MSGKGRLTWFPCREEGTFSWIAEAACAGTREKRSFFPTSGAGESAGSTSLSLPTRTRTITAGQRRGSGRCPRGGYGSRGGGLPPPSEGRGGDAPGGGRSPVRRRGGNGSFSCRITVRPVRSRGHGSGRRPPPPLFPKIAIVSEKGIWYPRFSHSSWKMGL